MSEAGLTVDLSRGHVAVDGVNVRLSYREFVLLRHLVAHPGVQFSREDLVTAQEDWSVIANPRTIDVHVRRLRQKIAPYGDVLRTRRGAGYYYDDHPDVRVVGRLPASA